MFNTAVPGFYAPEDYLNPSIGIINSGEYDGVALKVDSQPSDRIYGTRLEVELKNSEARGREQQAKVLVVGLCYDPQYKEGILDYEVLIFDDNKTLLTGKSLFSNKMHYIKQYIKRIWIYRFSRKNEKPGTIK